MSYIDLDLKQRRIIDVDLNILFSRKAVERSLSPEQMLRLGLFHPWLKNEDGSGLPLSVKGIAALERIGKQLETMVEVSDLSTTELRNEVFKQYTGWFRRRLHPNAEEFVTEFLSRTSHLIGEHHFLVVLKGVALIDSDILELGPFQLRRPSSIFLNTVKLAGAIGPERTFDQFNLGIWLTGAVRGSPETSNLRFEQSRLLLTGLLSLYGAILYEDAFCRTRIEGRVGTCTAKKTPSLLRWVSDGEDPSVSWEGDPTMLLPFDKSAVSYLESNCFLQELACLIENRQRSEIEDAIVRALYWFGDAQADRNATMRFVKLWSCVECFFSIQKEGITELVTKGMATILAFAGYQVIKIEQYAKFKRDLKRYYDLRSRALHRGEFGIVSMQQLSEFARLVGWLIVSSMALTQRGYTTLHQMREQAERLDSLASKS